MKKKWLTALLLVVVSCAIAVTMTACGDTPPAPTTYTVTVTSPTNGTVTVADALGETKDAYDENSAVTVTVTPAAHYAVESVTVGGKAVNLTDGTYTFAIKGNTTVAATFAKVTHGVTTAYDAKKGSVKVTDAADVEKDTFDEAATAKVTVTPAPAYVVDKVKVNGTDVTLDAGVHTFEVAADAHVDVTFALDADHKALSDAIAKIANAKNLIVEKDSNTTSSKTTTAFIFTEEIATSVSIGYSGPSISGGRYMYEGFARSIYSSYSSMTYKDEAGAMYKTIQETRATYDVADLIPYFELAPAAQADDAEADTDPQVTTYVLKDPSLYRTNSKRFVDAFMENKVFTDKKYLANGSSTVEDYSNISVTVENGAVKTLSFNYIYSDAQKLATYTYTAYETLEDTTEIQHYSYGSVKTGTYGAITTLIDSFKKSMSASALASCVGNYKNGNDTVVVALNGITVAGKEFVIIELPNPTGAEPTNNIGKAIKGTIDGKNCLLTRTSSTAVTVQVEGEATATEYAMPSDDIPTELIGTWTGSKTISFISHKYSLTITDATTASFHDVVDNNPYDGGDATAVKYYASLKSLILTIGNADYVFTVKTDSEGAITGLTYTTDSVDLTKQAAAE